MAFGRLERSAGARPIGDINMTPLIDVMLVLLVIFMIAAPFMTSGIRLDLPRGDAARPGDATRVIVIALDAGGQRYLGDEPLDAAALEARVAQAARLDPSTEVQLRADRNVPYGRVAELVGMVQKAGLTRIGFVTEPASGNAER